MIADVTGAGGVTRNALRGDKTGTAIAMAGMVFNKSGGNVTMGEARRLVAGWAKDPVTGRIADSINYHFAEHGAKVGAKNVGQYLRKAEAFARNLRGVKPTPVEGRTPGVLRYRKKGRYVDIAPDGKIVSFGSL